MIQTLMLLVMITLLGDLHAQKLEVYLVDNLTHRREEILKHHINNNSLSEDLIRILPKWVTNFVALEPEDREDLKAQYAEIYLCEQQFRTAYRQARATEKFTHTTPLEVIKDWWIKENPACYGIYKGLAPRIRLAFPVGSTNVPTHNPRYIYAHKKFVKTHQGASTVPRYSNPDLLLEPTIGTDTFKIEGQLDSLSPDLWLTLWSGHYKTAPTGMIPERAVYVMRIGMVFPDQPESVYWSEWFRIEI